MGFRRLLALLVVCGAIASQALGQGNPTGTLAGRVESDNQPLPGVSVTAKSVALQGSRAAVTGVNGDFLIPLLPPGDYTISFDMTSFQKVTRDVRINAAQRTDLNVEMKLTSVAAQAVVVAEKESISQNQLGAKTLTSNDIERLPVARTFASAVALTPGVTGSGPGGNTVISGSFSFENLFLVNGVVVNENLRGQPLNLFIEDAVQETTTSTSSISAEYGRFTGGVVNVLTKSGGNRFTGSFRTSFTNDDWRALRRYSALRNDSTPAQPRRNTLNDTTLDDTVPQYEATLGGPLWKDRVWFFGAGRFRDVSASATTASQTNIAYTATNNEKRYEGKLTLSPVENHTLLGSYIKIDQKSTNQFFTGAPILDLRSLSNREDPQDILSLNYTGTLTSSLFFEAQYSRRNFDIAKGSGSQFRDIVNGTLVIDRATGNRFWSPTFCGVCDVESRDNKNFLLKSTYYLSTKSLGSHSIAVGYDLFDDIRYANNYQSGSDYRLQVSRTSTPAGTSDVFAVVDPASTRIQWTPIFVNAQANRYRTHSVFLNDAWQLNNHLSFNLGVRWDKNDGTDSQGNKVVDDSKISPRLSAAFDPTGDGNVKFFASWARYVAGLANSIGDSGSAGGQPSSIVYQYSGPAINTSGTLLTTDQVIQRAFDWFFANGGTTRTPISVALSGVSQVVSGTLASPNTDEFSVGASGRLGRRASWRLDGVYRKGNDFYASVTDFTTGKATSPASFAFQGTFDRGITINSDVAERKHYGINVQFDARPTDRIRTNVSYSWGHTYGNFDGETGPNGPVTFVAGDYPQFKNPAWNTPRGDLLTDQRHKVRLSASYDVPIPSSWGGLNFGVLYAYDSGTPFGAVGTVNPVGSTAFPIPATAGLGCPTGVTNRNDCYIIQPTAGVNYYFTPRDAFRTSSVKRADLVMNYAFRFKVVTDFEIFLRPELLNVFNSQSVTAVNTTVLTNSNNAFNATTNPTGQGRFDPFTTVPSFGTGSNNHWYYGNFFGQPTALTSIQTPRTFRFSVGVRF